MISSPRMETEILSSHAHHLSARKPRRRKDYIPRPLIGNVLTFIRISVFLVRNKMLEHRETLYYISSKRVDVTLPLKLSLITRKYYNKHIDISDIFLNTLILYPNYYFLNNVFTCVYRSFFLYEYSILMFTLNCFLLKVIAVIISSFMIITMTNA